MRASWSRIAGYATSAERRERELVEDHVVHPRPRAAVRAGLLHERVCVVPPLVRPRDLLVDEAVRRLPPDDLRPPPEPDAEQAEAVLDQRPLADVDGLWRDDLEGQLGRRDALQVLGVGEKGEHLVAREREVRRGVEAVRDGHGRAGKGAAYGRWARADPVERPSRRTVAATFPAPWPLEMFAPDTYAARRAALAAAVPDGLIVLLGNDDAPMNYAANLYPFRQDGSFLYYTGLDAPGLAVALDAETGDATLYGTDPTIDDEVWEGAAPHARGARPPPPGCASGPTPTDWRTPCARRSRLGGRSTCSPPYRAAGRLRLAGLLGVAPDAVGPSEALLDAVIAQRLVKTEAEVAEIEQAVAIRGRDAPARHAPRPAGPDRAGRGRRDGGVRPPARLVPQLPHHPHAAGRDPPRPRQRRRALRGRPDAGRRRGRLARHALRRRPHARLAGRRRVRRAPAGPSTSSSSTSRPRPSRRAGRARCSGTSTGWRASGWRRGWRRSAS